MIHALIDAFMGVVGVWLGYKIGYATHRAGVREFMQKSPKTPYRDAAEPEADLKPEKDADPLVEPRPHSVETHVECPACGQPKAARRVWQLRDGAPKETKAVGYCAGGTTHFLNNKNVRCGSAHLVRGCDDAACGFEWLEALKSGPLRSAPDEA